MYDKITIKIVKLQYSVCMIKFVSFIIYTNLFNFYSNMQIYSII